MKRKRRIYGLAIGIVASQLSIAAVKNFGDCATCGPAPEINFPLHDAASLSKLTTDIQGKLGRTTTAFTHGNTMGAQPNLAPAQAVMAAAVKNMPQSVPQPPFVAPQFVPVTQDRVDGLFPTTWMQCLPSPVIAPYTPMFWPGRWI